jgi:hypothetical protein
MTSSSDHLAGTVTATEAFYNKAIPQTTPAALPTRR